MLNIRSKLRLAKPAAAALLLALAVSACATGPEYRPRGPGDVIGYTDQRLTQNRFRVTFTGSTGTHREEVEDHLLRRAAEVTLQNGFTHFVFAERDTEPQTYYRGSYPYGHFGLGFGYGAGFGRYGYGFGRYGYGLGPRSWYYSNFAFGDPWFGYGGFASSYPVTRYEAYSEIVALTAEQAGTEPDAIDAREVLASLPPLPPPPPA